MTTDTPSRLNRRNFLATGAGTAAAMAVPPAATIAAPGITSGRREIVLALPSTFDDMAAGASAFAIARRLEAGTAGRWHVAVQRIDVPGLEAVLAADADLYLAAEHQHAAYHPAFAAFAGLPLGEHLDASAHQAWLAVGGGQDLWDDLAASVGFKALMAGHTGPSAGLVSERVIESVADLAGARIAVRGLAGDVVRQLGAEPVGLTDSEIAAALKAGAIAAAEPLVDSGMPLAHWTYRPGISAGGLALSLGMRSGFWQQLSGSERVLLEGIAAEATALSIAEGAARRAMGRIAARSRHWPVAMATAPDLAVAIASAATAAIDTLGDFDPSARRIVDSVRAFRGLMGDSTVSPVA